MVTKPKTDIGEITYATLLSGMQKDFKNSEPASALAWWWADDKEKFGLRIEALSIMKEFTNKTKIGRDPEGLLFFNDLGDLEGTDKKYDIQYNSGVKANERAFVVRFYNDSDKRDKGYAQFIAKDPNDIVKEDTSKNHTFGERKGDWVDFKGGAVAAHVVKASTDLELTLTVPSIAKEVKFSLSDASVTAAGGNSRVDTWGLLTFKVAKDINDGKYFDYRADRIVFSKTQYSSEDFTAFFIPPETALKPQPLGKFAVSGTVANSKWTDT